jgi:hypothetical protein
LSKPLLIMIFAVLCVCITLAPDAARAAEVTCSATGITERLVTCIQIPLQAVTLQMVTMMYTMLKPAIAAFMVFVVILVGIKIASGGVRDLKSEVAVLAIKLVFVAYFTENFADWYPDIVAGILDSITIVTQPMLQSILLCPGTAADNLWARIDCLLITFLGLTAGASIGVPMLMTAVAGPGSDLAAMIPGIDTAITGMIVGCVTTIFLVIARTVLAFIAAQIAISFMFALAPLFVPLLLLQATRNYFTQWVLHMLSYAIQPLVLFAFLALALVCIDKTVFTGEYSLAAVMFGAPIESYEEWNTKLQETTSRGQLQVDAQLMSVFTNIEERLQNATVHTQTSEQTRNTSMYVVDEETQALQRPLLGVMNTVKGAAGVGVSIQTSMSAKPVETLIQLACLMMIFYLLLLMSDVARDASRDISGGFRNAALGRSFDLPGQSTGTEILKPENLMTFLK